jgi:hypothetical protein
MRLLIAGVLLLFGGVAPPEITGETPEDRDRARLRAMEEQIQLLIGTATCEADAECRSVPVGAKPCGRPWTYQVYSTRVTDSRKLLERVAAHRALNVALNRKYGWSSDCSVVSEPAVSCREGRCAQGIGRR